MANLNTQCVNGVTVATMDLEEQDIDEYYNGYANRTLWPLFHYRIDLTQYERSFGEGYERVNAQFADMLAPLIEPDDLIWVQDYHLIPLGRELRMRGLKNAMGFFLHIPWPARELILTLPRHRQLVEALFHYDVAGFHTEEWKDAFLSYAQRRGRPCASRGPRIRFWPHRTSESLPHWHRRQIILSAGAVAGCARKL